MPEKKAREYFNNEWIMEKERELRDFQRKEDAATDEDFFSPRLALRARVTLLAKYRVRPARLIKRLSCRLLSCRLRVLNSSFALRV